MSAAVPCQVGLPQKRSLLQQEEGNEKRLKTAPLQAHMTLEQLSLCPLYFDLQWSNHWFQEK